MNLIVGTSLTIIDYTGDGDPNNLEFDDKAMRWIKNSMGYCVDDVVSLIGIVLPPSLKMYWAEKVSADERIITGYGYPFDWLLEK